MFSIKQTITSNNYSISNLDEEYFDDNEWDEAVQTFLVNWLILAESYNSLEIKNYTISIETIFGMVLMAASGAMQDRAFTIESVQNAITDYRASRESNF
jgi:hypothetical protein